MAKILLMEDDFALAQTYVEALEDDGHKVSVAASGSEALVFCKQTRFDLAIVDLFVSFDGRISKDGGLILIGRLRNPLNDSTFPKDGPIIAISGSRPLKSEAAALDIAQGIGATETMSKPIDLTELLEVVRDLLPGPDP